MATYNNYYPAGYSPFGQPLYPTPVQAPQMQQPQMQSQNTIGNVWINSEMEALSYPVAPNSAVRLWSTTDPVMYLKQADVTGKPSIRIFDIIERTETASVISSESKTSCYATKEELSTVAGAIKAALTDIEQMKSDLYGVAGRKKAAKKVESEDDDT